MNAAETLLSTGRDEAVALICGDDALTYAQLRERVAQTAGWLCAHQVASGDRVIVTGADGIAWVTVWLGAVWAGAVAVGLNPRLRPEELGAILYETAARVCCADAEAAQSISTVSLSAPMKLVAMEGSEILRGEPVAPARSNNDDPAFWIYSSGTTGRPKAVVHAHRAVDACDAFAREVLGATAQDRLFATSRLFFAYALCNSLFAGLRLVKVAGRWVSTLDLQRELSNDLAGEVHDLAVAAVIGSEGLTGIALFAVSRPGREREARDRLQARLDQLPTHQRPRWHYWLDALPRTASGKLQLTRLREIHAGALGVQAT